MSKRPWYVSLGWTSRDYAKRVWDNAGEDNVLFLAGGVAFNLLLAAVPFILLLVTGLTYILRSSTGNSTLVVTDFIDKLLPPHPETPDTPAHKLLNDALQMRSTLGIYSAIGFTWFSTRLFGSLRTVLADVFDIEHERGIIAGKIFDVKITVVASLLFVASTVLNAYIAIATTRGVHVLTQLGVRNDLMGNVEYWLGRLLAAFFLGLMFFALYKYLPVRKVRWQTATVAALFTVSSFEIARSAFTAYVAHFNPGSLYTGTIAAIVIVVVWVYYAALIFILGGEVGQVYELRRVRRLQREVFTE